MDVQVLALARTMTTRSQVSLSVSIELASTWTGRAEAGAHIGCCVAKMRASRWLLIKSQLWCDWQISLSSPLLELH